MTINEVCFTALATSFFGVSHGAKSAVTDGRHLYGLAIQKLAAVVSNPTCSIDETLMAVFALSLHEVSTYR